MGHENRHAGTFKAKILRKFRPNPSIVYIAVHPPQGLEGPETIRKFQRAEIAGVPQLVAFGKVVKNPLVEQTVRVGKKAYARHIAV
jgi:hypothetical protein